MTALIKADAELDMERPELHGIARKLAVAFGTAVEAEQKERARGYFPPTARTGKSC